MDEHQIELQPLLWATGWLVAVLVLFWAGLRLPLQTRLGPRGRTGLIPAAWSSWRFASVRARQCGADIARRPHRFDAREALHTVGGRDEGGRRAGREVRVTYFYHSQDPRAAAPATSSPDATAQSAVSACSPSIPTRSQRWHARNGIRIYNAAMIEADGRRVLVQSTDEAEIALGIQRVLRERVITVCFIEGHGELPMDNFEFHTHLEGIADHSHDDASSRLVQMAGHGVGRFRRALEAQGYEARQLILATNRGVPDDCTLVVMANPRTTFLPGESDALRRYLANGGAALFLFDLGFVLEPGLARLIDDLGVRPEQQVVVDPLSHYMLDAEMVAVTGYDPHPITRLCLADLLSRESGRSVC